MHFEWICVCQINNHAKKRVYLKYKKLFINVNLIKIARLFSVPIIIWFLFICFVFFFHLCCRKIPRNVTVERFCEVKLRFNDLNRCGLPSSQFSLIKVLIIFWHFSRFFFLYLWWTIDPFHSGSYKWDRQQNRGYCLTMSVKTIEQKCDHNMLTLSMICIFTYFDVCGFFSSSLIPIE